ncbi:hypothetical protein EW145_g7097 [Phellinidium pouzarii]|uniref:Hcy-binding domain-containing protein n=1 Tax=Phellinidium pouzarii TaxID=167371 RepID=A0A4S4KP29_9AGAM|nr:hypothetical protein EW145_g7097 [Phellinidium pouzarii]
MRTTRRRFCAYQQPEQLSILTQTTSNDISSPLWSASLVADEPETIVKTHAAFLAAGADTILTSTYQCAFETFRRAGCADDAAAAKLMRKAVRLAAQAKLQFLESQASSDAPKKEINVVLSLGPYGATLSPAQEFDGLYPPPYGPQGYTPGGRNTNAFNGATAEERHVLEHTAHSALSEFHYRRLLAFVGDSEKTDPEGSVWPLIDAIAFETVPLAREAAAIRTAMGRLAAYLAAHNLEAKSWWLSTVWPGGRFPQEASPHSNTRLKPAEVVRALLQNVVSPDPDPAPAPDGIGVNCTQVSDLDAVVSEFRSAVQASQFAKKPFLVLYPNGGDTYDVVQRAWASTSADAHSTSGICDTVAATEAATVWAQRLAAIAKREQASGTWGGLLVGGCCKTGPEQIDLLRKKFYGD